MPTRMNESKRFDLKMKVLYKIKITLLLHLIGLHHSAATATVIPQHAIFVEVKTVLQEKFAVMLRERAMAPKVNVWQTFKKLCQQTIRLVHLRVEVWFRHGNEQARNDATHEDVSDAGNARYAKGEINDHHHGSLGSRTTAAELVRPEVEDHGVWVQLPDEIELRRCRKDIARLVIMPDIEHKCEGGGFFERKVILSRIARNEMIQAADVAVAQDKNDWGINIGIERTADRHACNSIQTLN